MRPSHRWLLSGALAVLLAACCPAPLNQPGETAFIATVLSVQEGQLSVELETGERLRVLATGPGLEPGQRVYVQGWLLAGRVEATSVQVVGSR